MKVTISMGDGIGPEIMKSVLEIFDTAGVPLEYETVEMGKKVALGEHASGIGSSARKSVETTGILFTGPMETPKGNGHPSVNVTARKLWGTFANKRVYRTLPGVPTQLGFNRLDLTMVRENIEDTYAAVEHMQTPDVAQCRRFITRPGSEQVHRYTFEMAARKGAQRVTCAHKASIMQLTDGLFLDTFYEVAKDFPEIEADDMLVDALAMHLVLEPTAFDVIVLPNFQGDILTDVAAGLVGGLAYAPSANIGDGICIFEAVHGTAPDIVGQDLANPTALLLSGTMMLRHVGLLKHASAIETALERTLARMHRRPDLGQPIPVFRTSVFTETMREELESLSIPAGDLPKLATKPRLEPMMRLSETRGETVLRGVDVFVESELPPVAIADNFRDLDDSLPLTMISNRGTEVWPGGSAYTDCVNHYRLRFESASATNQSHIVALIGAVASRFTICGAEWLRDIDGKHGYSAARGQNAN